MSMPIPGDLAVLARGATWAVVAKPPRLLVHRTGIARARHHALQLARDQLGVQVHPVHRLDRPASGCLLFALSRDAIPMLQDALAAPGAVKTYLAFVRGHWAREGTVQVDAPLRDAIGVPRASASEVECIGTSADPRCALLRVRPRTGRYHQVRRHVRSLDHPVLGDATHGDTRVNRWWREERGLARLGLHCVSLDLPLPDGRLQATCPVFEDLHALWSGLPWWAEAVAAEPALALPPLPVPDYLGGHGVHPGDVRTHQ